MKVWKNQDFNTNNKSQNQKDKIATENAAWEITDLFCSIFSAQSHWEESSD